MVRPSEQVRQRVSRGVAVVRETGGNRRPLDPLGLFLVNGEVGLIIYSGHQLNHRVGWRGVLLEMAKTIGFKWTILGRRKIEKLKHFNAVLLLLLQSFPNLTGKSTFSWGRAAH